MKDSIPVLAFALTLFSIQKIHVESYSLKCPSQGSWKIQAKSKCNSILIYFCLFNNLREKYVEGCEGPDWDRRGSKRTFSVSFTRGECTQKRYQPFRFQTNESMSDCIYAKSLCNEEGQIVYKDGSSKNDRTCRCDYTRNYSFTKTPKHVCYCLPTEEDCSCYIKTCQLNFTLSTDYDCTPNGYKRKPKCIDAIRDSTTIEKQIEVNTEKNKIYFINSEHSWDDTLAAVMLIFVCLICLLFIGLFVIETKKLHKIINVDTDETDTRRAESANTSYRFYLSCQDTDETDIKRAESTNTLYEVCHESFESITFDKPHADLTQDEVNYLRMIHLLFSVACPVVRMTFNHEIQPNQLRRTLDNKKAVMKKKYRKKERIINNFQWNLLYGPVTVTSDDFDIRIMIYLFVTLTNIEVGDLYPIQYDERLSAMLSKIKYIRTELAQSYEGTLSRDQFNKYWDDIAQAVFRLVYLHGTADHKDVSDPLISRLHMLNQIDLDNDKLCLYICMSEIYPAKILQQIIYEYCTLTEQTLEEILLREQHELYHKRIITESCCVCNAINVEFCTFTKVIPEKQWNILYKMKDCNNLHSCPSNLKKCCESFIPRKIDTCDLSVTIPLVLYIPDILTHVINRIYMNTFDTFLGKNKHAIYHSMERKRCCKCVKNPTEKITINIREWNKLFRKTDSSCQTPPKNCSCQYSVIHRINPSNIDDILLFKIVHVAGPISVFNKIRQDAFLYFLNWTVDDQTLRRAIIELLNLIRDDTFRHDMLQKMSSCNPSHLDDNLKKIDASQWISKQITNQEATSETMYRMYVFFKDEFKVKSIQVPKDLSLPTRTRQFKDLTDGEINFLLVVFGLTKIVYPAIKDEFDTKCLNDDLDKICREIQEQQLTRSRKDSDIYRNKRQKKTIFLTQKQQRQLLSTKVEESRNLDLKLMIYILRGRAEENRENDYVDQLDVIDTVRREIFQSSSGVLNKWKFQEILKLVRKAIVHIGGKEYDEKFANLPDIRKSLELL